MTDVRKGGVSPGGETTNLKLILVQCKLVELAPIINLSNAVRGISAESLHIIGLEDDGEVISVSYTVPNRGSVPLFLKKRTHTTIPEERAESGSLRAAPCNVDVRSMVSMGVVGNSVMEEVVDKIKCVLWAIVVN